MINGIAHSPSSSFVECASVCERPSSAERWRNERPKSLCGSFEMARHLNFDRTETASALGIDAMTDDVSSTAP